MIAVSIDKLNFHLETEGAQEEREPVTAAADTGRYQIQIASFANPDNADRAVEIAEAKFGLNFEISFNPVRKLHAVRSQPIKGLQTAIVELTQIRNGQFTHPVLVALDRRPKAAAEEAVSIQLGAFSSRERAEQFIRGAANYFDRELTLSLDSEDKLYKVRTASIPNLEEAQQKLRTLRNSRLFSDAFIPEDASGTPDTYDGSYFTYQVRIEGVTAEKEQAYLDRITGEERISDAVVNEGPETDVVLFDNVASWEQAIELQQNLSRITSMGEPVILLIERAAPAQD